MDHRRLLRVVVSYSSLERRFANALFGALNQLCDRIPACKVIVSVGSRLFDGSSEDEVHIVSEIWKHPRLTFTRFAVPSVKEGLATVPVYTLHNESRIRAVEYLRNNFDDGPCWFLFIDGDEVPDAEAFAAWFVSAPELDSGKKAFKLANYWYFLKPTLVSESYEDSVLLVHSSLIDTPGALQHPRERDGILHVATSGEDEVARNVLSLHGKPMFHHFSWVRGDHESNSRQGLLDKVRNWGHSRDRPWAALINTAFDDMDKGVDPETDFVHGRRLIRSDPDMIKII